MLVAKCEAEGEGNAGRRGGKLDPDERAGLRRRGVDRGQPQWRGRVVIVGRRSDLRDHRK